MEQNPKTSGKITTACFFTIWCAGTFGMGLFLLQMSQQMGPYGPPLIMALIPFGMGILGFLTCVSTLRSSGRQTPTMPSYIPETVVYSGDYSINPEFSDQARGGKAVYQVPSRCPACGAAISNEDVDWVGPLQAKCPYCNAIFDAVKRRL